MTKASNPRVAKNDHPSIPAEDLDKITPEATGDQQGRELTVQKEGDEWLADLSQEQQDEARAIKAAISARPRRPNVTVKYEDGVCAAKLGKSENHGDQALNSVRWVGASGSASSTFAENMLSQVIGSVRLTGDEAKDSQILTAAMALVASVDPQNELEATMAVQMVAANEAALMCFERSRKAKFMEHAAPYSNMANKAMRSFALHVEALAKLRRGGEQIVKHVHVNDGGQAVIAGTVNTGGGGER